MEQPEQKKQPKTVQLKQYFLTETPDGSGKDRKGAFILQTCALFARREFEEKLGVKMCSCVQTAESEWTKEDLEERDFWKEGLNWETVLTYEPPSESMKSYSELLDKGRRVQAAKRKTGIIDWDKATDKQRADFEKLMKTQK